MKDSPQANCSNHSLEVISISFLKGATICKFTLNCCCKRSQGFVIIIIKAEVILSDFFVSFSHKFLNMRLRWLLMISLKKQLLFGCIGTIIKLNHVFLQIQLYSMIKITVSTLKKNMIGFTLNLFYANFNIYWSQLADALVFVIFWKVCSRCSNINELASQREKRERVCVRVCVCLCLCAERENFHCQTSYLPREKGVKCT